MKRFAILLLFLFATAAPAHAQNCSPFAGVGAVQFIDNSGAPLTNGALYVYVAQSSTQASSFQDSQCSILNTNPVTFTTGGRATIWVNSSGFFKYVLCSSSTDGPFCAAGDILFSVDNVPGGSSGGGGGGSCSTGCTGFFISGTASPATSGVLRMASGDSFGRRNAAGSSNLLFSKDANDILTWQGGDEKYSEINCPTTAPTGADLICADQTAHRFKIAGNGGTLQQAVVAGVDISNTDSVTALHFGSTQETLSSTAPTTGQVLYFTGSNIAGLPQQEVAFGTGGATMGTGSTATCATAGFGTSNCVVTILVNAHTLIRFTYNLALSPSGCSTNAVVGVRDLTSSTTLTSLTITNGQALGVVDSGAISVAMTAGHQFGVGTITAAAGCTTSPTYSGTTMVYQ